MSSKCASCMANTDVGTKTAAVAVAATTAATTATVRLMLLSISTTNSTFIILTALPSQFVSQSFSQSVSAIHPNKFC